MPVQTTISELIGDWCRVAEALRNLEFALNDTEDVDRFVEGMNAVVNECKQDSDHLVVRLRGLDLSSLTWMTRALLLATEAHLEVTRRFYEDAMGRVQLSDLRDCDAARAGPGSSWLEAVFESMDKVIEAFHCEQNALLSSWHEVLDLVDHRSIPISVAKVSNQSD